MKRFILASAICLVGASAAAQTTVGRPTWSLDLLLGVAESGRLYSVLSDVSRQWESPEGVGIEGTEIRTDFTTGFNAALQFEKPIRSRLAGIGRLALSQLEIRALRRTQVNNVDDLGWDTMSLATAEAGINYSFLDALDTPYFVATVGVMSVASEGSALDQSGATLGLGMGYRIGRFEGIQFGIEARANFFSWDFEAEKERLGADEFIEDGGAIWQVAVSMGYPFRGISRRR